MKDGSHTFDDAIPRTLCTDCGLSRTEDAKMCGKACQFIKPDYGASEERVHGRRSNGQDETFFGVTMAMHKASLTKPLEGAQWTGLTTRIAERLLETESVDAVLTVVPEPNDKWAPVPALITSATDMKYARGMRMGFAPLLALLRPAAEAGHRRIAVIGIPCQIHALRAMERSLGFEKLYVIGTPCSDNTTTENFHLFLSKLSATPKDITYLEFRADYHVELRFTDGTKQLIPFLKLPLSDLPQDFFPLTCKTCVDYTNRLSDITVGYMAGEGEQWLIVRNQRGADLLALLDDDVRLTKVGTAGNRMSSVKGFIENTKRAAGGLPLRRMPRIMRTIVAWLMPRVGPRGMEFARARLEMKAAETVLHLEREAPAKMKNMVPQHVWDMVARYGLTPAEQAENKQTNSQ